MIDYGLKNRGVEDILIACVDGLNGFPQAIEAVYPKTEIQQCIIHQIRNSTKFVSYKDIKKLMADLKLVYAAPTEETALNELELFKDKWDSKYPKIYKSWHDNWATLSTYFKYPEAVRRLIYTTNAIEGFNRQLRKVTKSKTIFPSDDSLLKMLYLATMDITKKWTGHRFLSYYNSWPVAQNPQITIAYSGNSSVQRNIIYIRQTIKYVTIPL